MEATTNGVSMINDILRENLIASQSCSSVENWPDSVHHQSWHDSWRDSH